jgi:hypothetical protein
MEATYSVGKTRTRREVGRVSKAVLAVSLFACAGFAAQKPQPSNPPIPTTITPKAQALINRVIQTLGGQAFLHWKTLETKGRVFEIQEGETAGYAPFRSTVEPPDKRRFSYGSGHPVTLINNGDEGWQIDQYGTIHQKPSDIRRWQLANRYSLDNILRYLIHERGLLAEDEGTDFINNQPARVLEILDSRQAQIKIYLDQETDLPLEVAYHVVDSVSQEPRDYTDVYSDYQVYQGIRTPTHVTRYADGDRVAEVFRTSVSYDAPHPADFFEPSQ